MLSLPLVIAHGQLLKVPTPFDHVSLRRQDHNQPEGAQLAQRQLHYTISDFFGAAFSRQRANDLSTTNDIMPELSLDAVPVDQCEANTGIVHCDPRAALGFPRKERATRYVIFS